MLQQECYQFLQDYHDKFVAHKNVFEQLGIKMGVSERGKQAKFEANEH